MVCVVCMWLDTDGCLFIRFVYIVYRLLGTVYEYLGMYLIGSSFRMGGYVGRCIDRGSTKKNSGF